MQTFVYLNNQICHPDIIKLVILHVYSHGFIYKFSYYCLKTSLNFFLSKFEVVDILSLSSVWHFLIEIILYFLVLVEQLLLKRGYFQSYFKN